MVAGAVVLFISTDEGVIDIDTNDANQHVFLINSVQTLCRLVTGFMKAYREKNESPMCGTECGGHC